MAVTLTIAGTSYSYPSGTDTEWGSDTTVAMQAVASNAIWKDGSVALTANWDAGSFKIQAQTFKSDVATGTAPFTVASTTEVANLKAATASLATAVEGTGVLSTGPELISKFLRADGDGTCSWQAPSATVEGTAVLSTGPEAITKFLRADGDGTCSWQTAGSDKPERSMDYPAGSFDYPAANPAPLDSDTGTNGTIKRQLFDDSTEEYVIGQFEVPFDLTPGGTVTFETYGYATTADGNEIQLRFGHQANADSATWDAAFTDEDSGDQVTDATQDDYDRITWTETVSNLGWAANDMIRFQLSRVAIDDGTPLSGDYGLVHLRIRIPRT